jgi:hypothetical protein
MAARPRAHCRRCFRFPAGAWLLDGAAWGAVDRRRYSTRTARHAPVARPALSMVGRLAFAAAIIGWPANATGSAFVGWALLPTMFMLRS